MLSVRDSPNSFLEAASELLTLFCAILSEKTTSYTQMTPTHPTTHTPAYPFEQRSTESWSYQAMSNNKFNWFISDLSISFGSIRSTSKLIVTRLQLFYRALRRLLNCILLDSWLFHWIVWIVHVLFGKSDNLVSI